MTEGRAVWRTGRRVGRTIYEQVASDAGDDDRLIGVMDTAELATAVVLSFNQHRFVAAQIEVSGLGEPAGSHFVPGSCAICGLEPAAHAV